jgi:hypothetical protein
MKTFTIDKENYHIALHSAVDDATAIANAERFRNEAEFAKLAADWPGARLIDIWNRLPEVTPVRKFKDRATAIRRIWRALQSLGEQPETVVARTPEPTLGTPATPQTPHVGLNEAPAMAKGQPDSGAAKAREDQGYPRERQDRSDPGSHEAAQR